ncbi:MAG: ankyrin repeat domain-containing protein [Rhodanobacteraceae bacterium]|nr:ankyrin repeat domain-containing protein [Rhodanobacteraceae bacterium]
MPVLSPQRRVHGLLAVLAALACVAGAVRLAPPAAWLLWLALPLLAFARSQGPGAPLAQWRGPDGRRRVALALALPLAGGLLCDLLLSPLLGALRAPDRLYPILGLSALLVGMLVAQWRSWPWFGLLFHADLPAAAEDVGLWRRLRERAHELTAVPDAYFSDGLPVAAALLAALAAPALLPLWPADWPQWLLALLLLALLAVAVELVLRGTARAVARPQPLAHLPSFLLDGNRGGDEITDPDPWFAPAPEPALPPGPDHDLLLAARRGDGEGVRAALARGADPNAAPAPESADQRSALIAAATAADRGALRALIAAGAQIDRVCGGLTALLAATRDSYAGRIDAVMTLLANGANPNLTDDAGNTPLHLAALTRDAGVAQSLLDAGARLDAINRDDMTPLALACEAGNWVVVEFLLKRGAHADVDGATPALLFAAAVDGDDPKGVKLLLKARAKVNARGPQGRTALMVAALADNAEIAEALLAAGAELAARDDAGRDALLEAARAGARRVLQRLVFHRPDPRAQDADGRGALHLAAQAGNADGETLKVLLALGCPADAQDARGMTAADIAAAAGRWPQVRILDPAYPLPSTHIADEHEEPAAPPERIEPDPPGRLLVRAAMQGRFPLYQELLEIPGISGAELAEALRAALPHQDRRYIEAVVDSGHDPFARDAGGWSLWERLCAEAPAPLELLQALLERAPRHPAAAGVLLPGLCLIPQMGDGEEWTLLRETALALGDVQASDVRGRPLLLAALAQLPLGWIERLIAAGADARVQDADGHNALTALAWARRDDAREIAPLLVRAGADPARRARDGTTAAGIAQLTGQDELARLLDWPPGAHPGVALDGRAVAAAGKRGDLPTLDRLLTLGLDIDGVDEQGATALLHAVGTGQLELCKALAERGADLRRANRAGVSPLAAAILANKPALIDWLLGRGVDLEGVVLGRMTPLGLAAACLRQPLVDSLLQRGADAEGRAAPESPLQAVLALIEDPARPLAAIQAVVTRLLEAGANPDRPDRDGRTPLHRMLGAGRVEPALRDEARLQPLVQTLLQAGANPNVQDADGRTPLHWCCRHGLVLCGGCLLELGADPRVADANRQLPIDLLSPRYRIHLGPALRQAAEAWNRQRGPR